MCALYSHENPRPIQPIFEIQMHLHPTSRLLLTKTTDRIPLVLAYNQGNMPISRAIYKLWPILQINDQDLFRPLPLLTNKVGIKILNQLIRAEFSSTHSGKIGKTFLNPVKDCKKTNCRYCPRMNNSKHFTCSYTGYRYTKKLHGHCTTRNLVYLITCTKCAKQYVGETKREQILPTDPEDDRSTIRRRQCERYWIYQLHSLKPFAIIEFG